MITISISLIATANTPARGVGGHVAHVSLKRESAQQQHRLIVAILGLVATHRVRLQLHVVVMAGDFISQHQGTLHVELHTKVQLQERLAIGIQTLEVDFGVNEHHLRSVI